MVKSFGSIQIRGCFQNFVYGPHDENGFCVMNIRLQDIISIEASIPEKLRPKLGSNIKASGSIPYEKLGKGMLVEISGNWEVNKYGYQVSIESFVVPVPVDEKGIEFYLASGFIQWIGPKTAANITRHFGVDTLKILDEAPERLAEVPRLGKKMAAKISEKWVEQRQASRILESLVRMQISPKFAKKAIAKFGDDAAERIKENPYILMQIGGISFLKADKIARLQKFAADHHERIKAGLLFALEQATTKEGHCFVPEAELINRAASSNILNLPAEKVADVLKRPVTGNLFESQNVSGIISVLDGVAVCYQGKYYLQTTYDAERRVAAAIKLLSAGGKHPKIQETIVEGVLATHPKCSFLTSEQRAAVLGALRGRLSVITGLPGVGKTTTIKAILTVLDTLKASYMLAAPTGKAAKRLTEQTGVVAQTIHRLLETSREGFQKNEKNPIAADFVFIDEVSMLDINMAQYFFRAIQGNTCVVLIGDPNQLPSIGAGNLLRDIIALRLCPVYELTKIQRQAEASPIIRVAHAIYQGKGIGSISNSIEFCFVQQDDPVAVKDKIVDVVVNNEHYYPNEIQVLTPMRKGHTGMTELNVALKTGLAEQNRAFVAKSGFELVDFSADDIEILQEFTQFSYGDRVIQNVNNYDKSVFNGEIGYVVAFDPDESAMDVLFDDHRLVRYQNDECSQLQLAYALTIHRSQGSEFTSVVIPVMTEHFIMLFRNLIYTAVTRAKKQLILVGTEKAINIAIRNNKPIQRWTDLGRL